MNRFNRILFATLLALKSLSLCPMDLPPIQEIQGEQERKICYSCACAFLPISTDDACRHKLCNDCFERLLPVEGSYNDSGLIFDYFRASRDFVCSACNTWLELGIKKIHDEGSNDYFIEELCYEMNDLESLLGAFEFVDRKRSSENLSSAQLLKKALIKNNRSLCSIKDNDGNTLLNYMCAKRSRNIKHNTLILNAAGNDAWKLITSADRWQHTPFINTIRNLCNYGDDRLPDIKKMLSYAPSKADAWTLINGQDFNHNTALTIVRTGLEFSLLDNSNPHKSPKYLLIMHVIELFESYRPE